MLCAKFNLVHFWSILMLQKSIVFDISCSWNFYIFMWKEVLDSKLAPRRSQFGIFFKRGAALEDSCARARTTTKPKEAMVCKSASTFSPSHKPWLHYLYGNNYFILSSKSFEIWNLFLRNFKCFSEVVMYCWMYNFFSYFLYNCSLTLEKQPFPRTEKVMYAFK